MDYDVFYDDMNRDDDLTDYYDEDDLEELLKAYQDGYYSDDSDHARMPLMELFSTCLKPTLTQTLQMLAPLYAACFIFRLVCLFVRSESEETGIPRSLLHVTGAIAGLVMLNYFFGATVMYLLICCFSIYVILFLTSFMCKHLSGMCVAIFVGVYIVVCELYVVEASAWHRIRGAQIILSMKVIGLAFDLSSGELPLPSMPEYLGYCLSVGTVIFGPWVSFQDYMNVTGEGATEFLEIQWFVKVVKKSVIGLVCLVYSTCIVNWIFVNDYSKWILAYRDAQSFRSSHYFVCFISESTAMLSGIGNGDLKWSLAVSKPSFIELPRSLVDVVTNWNLPMHHWLKTYVFKVTRPFGTFTAIVLTYAASSLLHGINFQLAAVLFSLGFYSYAEFVFRDKLSRIYSACIQAKSCSDQCSHQYKQGHPFVKLTNLCFGILSVFHLAYLGLMFDSSSQQEEIFSSQMLCVYGIRSNTLFNPFSSFSRQRYQIRSVVDPGLDQIGSKWDLPLTNFFFRCASQNEKLSGSE